MKVFYKEGVQFIDSDGNKNTSYDIQFISNLYYSYFYKRIMVRLKGILKPFDIINIEHKNFLKNNNYIKR